MHVEARRLPARPRAGNPAATRSVTPNDPPVTRPSPSRPTLFLLALLLLAGVGIASIWGIVEFSQAAQRIEHSYRVLAKSKEIEASVRAAESAARAYRLIEAPEQHAEYLATAPRAAALTDELVTLVADSPAHASRAADVRRLVLARLAELQRLVELQNAEGVERARELRQAEAGIRLMREAASAHDALEAAERAVLAEGEAQTSRQAWLLIVIVVVGTVLPIVLMAVLLGGLSRENRRARRFELEARAAIDALEDAAIHRDRLSEQRRRLGTFASLLQSCQTLEEAMTLTTSVANELLPHAGGRCYIMRESQNLAQSAADFGTPAAASAGQLQPDDCWALRRGQIHATGPDRASIRCAHVDPAAGPDEWTLCVPMTAQGATLGLVHVSGRSCDDARSGDAEAVEAVAEQLSQTVANLRLRESLRVQSLRDPLTGLYNRRYLEENLFRELQRCERRGLPLSVMMIDVDHFKRFNDEHGHAAGDAILASVAETLGKLTRGEDIACRFGGEEFTIVLPEAPLDIALRRAEQIRAAVATASVIHLRRPIGPVTVSIGVATSPGQGESPDHLLAVADSALYQAKAQGRNRVVCLSGDAIRTPHGVVAGPVTKAAHGAGVRD